jgi:cell wall-associated NlpC family hydrolase
MKLFLLLSVLLLSACASTHKATSVVNEVLSAADQKILFEDIPTYSKSLIGTPYKFGGTSPDSGFDCSGFVADVFRHTAGITIPHSTSEINHIGRAIRAEELRSGDLVFFNTLKKKFSHVGIYLGDDRFIHAPSKGGKVRIENMSDAYWKKNYDGARRINLQL